MKGKATQSKPYDERKENQHEYQYSKPSTWTAMILISTCIHTTIRSIPINWHPWAQTENKNGDGLRHTMEALAFPNTISQYTNQVPVCGSMRLASTPIDVAVLLDCKAKASPLPDSSIKHVRKMPQTELDNDCDMPRPESPLYRHEPSQPALPNAETFTTPKPNMIAFAAPIAHSNPQCSKAFWWKRRHTHTNEPNSFQLQKGMHSLCVK